MKFDRRRQRTQTEPFPHREITRMHRLTPSFAPGRRSGGAGPRLLAAALAAGLLTGGLAASAPAADAAQPVHVKIKDHALIVTGTTAGDRIALRLSATDRQTLEVDVGDDGSATSRLRATGSAASAS